MRSDMAIAIVTCCLHHRYRATIVVTLTLCTIIATTFTATALAYCAIVVTVFTITTIAFVIAGVCSLSSSLLLRSRRIRTKDVHKVVCQGVLT